MPETINYRFKLRRGVKATLVARNEVPFDGEIVYATDTGEAKVGDGSTAYNALPYIERGFNLSRLGDVNAAAKADKKFPLWDAASSKHIYSTESAFALSNLGDVDASAKADGRMVVWDGTATKHKYALPPSGGATNPLPSGVIHWLALRHRNGIAGKPAFFANSPVSGVGAAQANANANACVYSEAINGLLGMRFGGANFFTLSPAVQPSDFTTIAVVKAPTASEWSSLSPDTWSVIASGPGSVGGSCQFNFYKNGDGTSSLGITRSNQALICSDSAIAGIAAGTLLVASMTCSGNNNVATFRNGTQTVTGTGASFTQPITQVGGVDSNERCFHPICEIVMFDRVLSSTDHTAAVNYLKGIWGIP